jgi:hypothetical protein
LRMSPAMAAGIADRLCQWRILSRGSMPMRPLRSCAGRTRSANAKC